MPRTALVVSYNGQPFHGWQFQPSDIPTVQQHLMGAVAEVADHDVTLFCAGRTDTGVHATKQVVHFDHDNERPDKAWVMGVNAHLSDAVSVEWAGQVDDGFDARRTATARRYLYLIHNNRVRSSLMADFITHERRSLDAPVMHRAAQSLLGENDFSSFRAANCQSNSPMRFVSEVSVKRYGDLVGVEIQANAFLHHMVRNIVGALMDVGAGDQEEGWISELMQVKDRNQAGVTAAPNGLYLIDVVYPEVCGIPQGRRLPHLMQLFQ